MSWWRGECLVFSGVLFSFLIHYRK
jgi:hypothetical protein